MHIETFERRRHRISLTPLIDVVFILLVFFMLATSFADWRPIGLATGSSDAADSDAPPAVIRVSAAGELRYRQQRLAPDELAQRLVAARERGDISAVIVQPADTATLDVTVRALDALAGAGVEPLSLATDGTAP